MSGSAWILVLALAVRGSGTRCRLPISVYLVLQSTCPYEITNEYDYVPMIGAVRSRVQGAATYLDT